MQGHSIECRIYAEDPDQGFIPSPGKIERLREPSGSWVRVDSAVYPKAEISIYYDPMIAKLITWGPTREEAIQRMERALREYQIVGVKNNIAFHEAVLAHPEFRQGKYDTGFIERNLAALKQSVHEGHEEIAAIAALLYQTHVKSSASLTAATGLRESSPWKSIGRREGMRS